MQQLRSLFTKEAAGLDILKRLHTNYHVQLYIPNGGWRYTNKKRVSKRYALHIRWNALALCFHLNHRSSCRSPFVNVRSDFGKRLRHLECHDVSLQNWLLQPPVVTNFPAATIIIMWRANTDSLRVLAVSSVMVPIQHGVLNVKTLCHVLLKGHTANNIGWHMVAFAAAA